ncbi:MAG: dehypoxanthine futalosine cyclase [Bacteroidetes bacterium]|nr:dehypoxanthine futalosine cyclase [Bacteroidota bacterium]
MQIENLVERALNLEFLTEAEGLFLYQNAPTNVLIQLADAIRRIKNPDNKVTWLIDRNVNITNVCVSGCKFCNFHRSLHHEEAYVTSIEEYKTKIEELFALGGNQLLLQGGHHPKLGLKFYTDLFSELKSLYPNLKLHALGPPEIFYLAKKENITTREVLEQLKSAGLDSLPGAGAEILCDRVRKLITKNKCSAQEWLDVMRVAHQLSLTTSATMMFGHVETPEERIKHLILLREVQSEKPLNSKGFIAFIPWTFQDEGTFLKSNFGITNKISTEEYIRMLAISRILLVNFDNIQVSWLTVGKDVGQVCLHAGANDFGSIMIEENVVSSAGANNMMDETALKQAIIDAGFLPQKRNQQYEFIS